MLKNENNVLASYRVQFNHLEHLLHLAFSPLVFVWEPVCVCVSVSVCMFEARCAGEGLVVWEATCVFKGWVCWGPGFVDKDFWRRVYVSTEVVSRKKYVLANS